MVRLGKENRRIAGIRSKLDTGVAGGFEVQIFVPHRIPVIPGGLFFFDVGGAPVDIQQRIPHDASVGDVED